MRILICGAGIAGLSLALRLLQLGHEPALVEQSPGPRGGGYMIDFFGSGYDAAERMGLLPELQKIHYTIAQLRFFDGSGRERFALPYKLLRKRLFDNSHFNFMRGELELVLYSQIQKRVEVHFGATIDSIHPDGDGVFAMLSDGSQERWDVVVGADGIHSRVRALAFGEEANFLRFLGYHTAAFVVDHVPESLSARHSFDSVTVPGRQVAVYPIRGGRLATFFCHRAMQPAGHLSRDAALRKLHADYGDLDWIVGQLLQQAECVSDIYYDDIAQIVMPHWSSGRVVLLGDACDAVSLLAGQGASMAMAAGYILAEELQGANTIEAALQSYENRVRPIIEQKQAAGRKVVGWFIPDTAFRLSIRDLAMRLSIWPVTSFVVRRMIAGESIFRN